MSKRIESDDVPIDALLHLLEVADDYTDQGPRNEGWQSDKLIRSIAQVEDFIVLALDLSFED